MKNRSCPSKVSCWDYDASNCDDCAIGKLISKQKKKIAHLKSENAALRADLLETISFALSLCDDEMCTGDLSCGIFPCEMFKDFTKEGYCVDWDCKLKRLRRKLEERHD